MWRKSRSHQRRRAQALDSSEGEFGDLPRELAATLGSLHGIRRQPLDGVARIEIQQALPHDAQRGVLQLALAELRAGELAQQLADAIELGAHRVLEDRVEVRSRVDGLVRQDAAERGGTIGVDEALEDREDAPLEALFRRAAARRVAEGALMRLPGEKAQGHAIEALLAAEVVIHRGEVA